MAARKKAAHKKTRSCKIAVVEPTVKTARPTISRRQAEEVALGLIREMDAKPQRRPSRSFSLKDTATGSGRVVFHAAHVLTGYGAKRPRRRRGAER